MNHTKEPWEWSEHKFNSPPFEGTLERECGIYPPLGESGPVAIASGKEDARRIVACVNACAGISTERLEDLGRPLTKHLFGADDHAAEMVKQRDELLQIVTAIEAALQLPDSSAAEVLDENSPIRDAIRTAIAKATS